MKTLTIAIKEIQDIMTFIEKASKVEPGVNVYKGSLIFDGGSLMGMMAIDMATGVDVEYPSDAKDFEDFIKQFEK